MLFASTLPETVAPKTLAGFFSKISKIRPPKAAFHFFPRAPLALSRLGGALQKGQNRLASYRRPSGFGICFF
jgi:hypothetical protein